MVHNCGCCNTPRLRRRCHRSCGCIFEKSLLLNSLRARIACFALFKNEAKYKRHPIKSYSVGFCRSSSSHLCFIPPKQLQRQDGHQGRVTRQSTMIGLSCGQQNYFCARVDLLTEEKMTPKIFFYYIQLFYRI
jgi:hypothetical protein